MHLARFQVLHTTKNETHWIRPASKNNNINQQTHKQGLQIKKSFIQNHNLQKPKTKNYPYLNTIPSESRRREIYYLQ